MLTVNQIIRYYRTAKRRYPITDAFSRRYRQRSGGYIAFAEQQGLPVGDGEPDQRWHLRTYIDRSLLDGTIPNGDYPFSRCYMRLKCPEMILYLCESTLGSTAAVRSAAAAAAQEIESGGAYCRTRAAGIIKKRIPWSAIETAVATQKGLS